MQHSTFQYKVQFKTRSTHARNGSELDRLLASKPEHIAAFTMVDPEPNPQETVSSQHRAGTASNRTHNP